MEEVFFYFLFNLTYGMQIIIQEVNVCFFLNSGLSVARFHSQSLSSSFFFILLLIYIIIISLIDLLKQIAVIVLLFCFYFSSF
jgi:hypothetical protein